ncbi:MAG: zinc-ribbon domain-containing protein [Christensenellales bacterium]|jgi:uncharacterized membrane protein
MIFKAYGAAIGVLAKKPFRLWGLSLLCQLLIALACSFGVLPIIFIPITLTLQTGMIAIYMAGLRGEQVDSQQLFAGFKDFKRICAGMAWQQLWILIWGLIPVAGPVFAIIKSYQYRFVPYILLTRPEVSPTEALKISIEETKGYRGQLFGADILFSVILSTAFTVLLLLCLIPYAGYFFMVVLALAFLLIAAVGNLFIGLYQAKLYESIQEARQYQPPKCPTCGAPYAEGYTFCPVCGTKLG